MSQYNWFAKFVGFTENFAKVNTKSRTRAFPCRAHLHVYIYIYTHICIYIPPVVISKYKIVAGSTLCIAIVLKTICVTRYVAQFSSQLATTISLLKRVFLTNIRASNYSTKWINMEARESIDNRRVEYRNSAKDLHRSRTLYRAINRVLHNRLDPWLKCYDGDTVTSSYIDHYTFTFQL